MNSNNDDTVPSFASPRPDYLEEHIKLYDEKLNQITLKQEHYKTLVAEMGIKKCNLASAVTCQDILVETANETSDLSYSND